MFSASSRYVSKSIQEEERWMGEDEDEGDRERSKGRESQGGAYVVSKEGKKKHT